MSAREGLAVKRGAGRPVLLHRTRAREIRETDYRYCMYASAPALFGFVLSAMSLKSEVITPEKLKAVGTEVLC